MTRHRTEKRMNIDQVAQNPHYEYVEGISVS